MRIKLIKEKKENRKKKNTVHRIIAHRDLMNRQYCWHRAYSSFAQDSTVKLPKCLAVN